MARSIENRRSNVAAVDVPDHQIQLRKMWDADFGEVVRKIDLPTRWSADGLPLKISRRFQAPRISNPAETVHLRLENASGIVRVSLNGAILARSLSSAVCEIPLTGVLERSQRLELHLDPSVVPHGEDWGVISLMIRS